MNNILPNRFMRNSKYKAKNIVTIFYEFDVVLLLLTQLTVLPREIKKKPNDAIWHHMFK